jgi:hypothetical protein
MIRTIPNSDEFNTLDLFDDSIDAALIGDADVDAVLDSMHEDVDKFVDDEDDDIVDTNIDYTDDEVDNSLEGMDADDIIAAERDIAFDPFEDDEIIDTAIGDDADILDNDIDVNDLADDDDDI